MARRRRHAPLNVFLNGRLVGVLRREASGAVDFRYAASWLGWEHALPVSLSLPLREDRYIGAPVTAVFDNLLPDGDAVRRRIAARTGADGVDAYSLLSAIGRDCVGALQFLPDDAYPGTAGAVASEPIDDEAIAGVLGNLDAMPLGLDEDEAFRISLAGAQEKTALLRRDGTWHKPLGTTATTHILKPPIGRSASGVDLSDSVENEYLCLKLLGALGLPVARAEIAAFAGRKALVVERFDRRWTADGRLLRLPQEDCCQALGVPPSRKYEADGGPGAGDVLALLAGSDDPGRDRGGFLKALLAFWLLGATDGHAKNFSLFLSPGGRFRLAPLYDVISVQPGVDAGQVRRGRMTLSMAVGDGRHYRVDEIHPRHFVQTAGAAGIGRSLADAALRDVAGRAEAAVQATFDTAAEAMAPALVRSLRAGVRDRLGVLAAYLG